MAGQHTKPRKTCQCEAAEEKSSMADQFQAGSCSDGSWWNTARTGGPMIPASVSCSTEITSSGGSFHWPAVGDVFEAKSRSRDESPVSISNSSITFQDLQNSHGSAPVITTPPAMDFGLSSPTADWSQPFFCSSMNGSSFLHDHHVLSSKINNMPLLSASGGLPSALLQDLLEPDSRLERSLHDAQVMKNKSSIDYHEQLLPPKQQTHYSDKTPFWDPSESSVTEAHSSYCNNPFAKANSGVGVSFPTLEKKGGSEPAGKKPRIEKQSPLPTFKVRKEKLGDRVTALQQLVSPFGKTDTASVLHEAIEYIKFLHDQVRVSSAPYLTNSQQMQQVNATKSLDKTKDCEGQHQDLRSRGLCLVPISSTFAVANEIPTDLWSTTFIGTFR
ncbi:transcription factor bHLH112-like [Musa acuminata AAA Group]|uniref:transcription factor bHLH112-like n=1 Tax=Musa acuminata AAA Group TaxID=214697 RepID=UPI0031E19E25